MINPEEPQEQPQKSLLEMTLQDHRVIHSTPDEELEANPGKTKAELMSDEDLLRYLNELEESASGKFAGLYIDELDRSIKYLNKIGRLPKEYSEQTDS